MIASTPRPTALVKEILADPGTVISKGSTYDNRMNLPAAYIQMIRTKYEGTKLAQQEIYGKVIDDSVDALWTRDTIDASRETSRPEFQKIVVGVDPAATSTEESAETGIVVAARQGGIFDGHIYVLDDASLRGSPNAWGSAVVAAYHKNRADIVIAEKNNGGDMVKSTIQTVDPNVPVELVHASRGKRTRAEPISALYEQGRGHHLGNFPELEDQMCQWVPGATSPDRLDALVWACSALIENAPLTQESVVVYDAYERMGGTVGAFPGMD
jgi:phage terminase large subunit-like protein